MTKEEAIQLLDQAVSQVAANRETHIKLQEAIQVLNESTEPEKTAKK